MTLCVVALNHPKASLRIPFVCNHLHGLRVNPPTSRRTKGNLCRSDAHLEEILRTHFQHVSLHRIHGACLELRRDFFQATWESLCVVRLVCARTLHRVSSKRNMPVGKLGNRGGAGRCCPRNDYQVARYCQAMQHRDNFLRAAATNVYKLLQLTN